MLMEPGALALWLQVLDYAGVALFAATGALAAARRNHDFVTFAFFAAVTGVGGGTLRDLLIGAPVFWVVNPAYLLVSTAAAGGVWLLAAWPRKSKFPLLLSLDAVGMAAYSVMGSAKALGAGVPWGAALVMGVMTATFGGIIRDVLAHEPSVLLRREIYITAAVLGSATFVLAKLAGAPFSLAAGLGFAAALTLRSLALWRGWSMPGYRGRLTGEDLQRPPPGREG